MEQSHQEIEILTLYILACVLHCIALHCIGLKKLKKIKKS
jgi:hypothetical protein